MWTTNDVTGQRAMRVRSTLQKVAKQTGQARRELIELRRFHGVTCLYFTGLMHRSQWEAHCQSEIDVNCVLVLALTPIAPVIRYA